MPYDSTKPVNGILIDADFLREQFNALKDAMDAIPRITAVEIDAVNTIDPGQPAGASVQIIGTVLHLTLNIPRGAPGTAGADGTPGGPGPAGPQGPPFANAIIGGVSTLNPGDNAWVTVSFDGTNVQFFFGIPRGIDGQSGLTQQQLDNAILGTSRNSDNVPTLNQTADANYNPSQMQMLFNRMDDLINALRR